MWSPSGDDNNGNNRLTSSSSSSSSRLSTPGRTMEDVWKDISLNSLQERPRSREEEAEPKGSYRRMMLQEFLARPFRGQQQQQQQQQEKASEVPAHHPELNTSILAAASNLQPATTILNLNSSPEQFHYLDSIGQLGPNPMRLQPHNSYGGAATPPPFMAASSLNNTFEAIGSSFCKKREPENMDNAGDRRHKRMIKNRESAARSRARKQVFFLIFLPNI